MHHNDVMQSYFLTKRIFKNNFYIVSGNLHEKQT